MTSQTITPEGFSKPTILAKREAEEERAARKITDIDVGNLSYDGTSCSISWKAADGSARFHIWVRPDDLGPVVGWHGADRILYKNPPRTADGKSSDIPTRHLDQTAKANRALIRFVKRYVRENGLVEKALEALAAKKVENDAKLEDAAEAARIKDAAPDLYAALKALRAAVHAGVDSDPKAWAEAETLTGAAIAKAEGRETNPEPPTTGRAAPTAGRAEVYREGGRWHTDLVWSDGSIWHGWQGGYRSLLEMRGAIRATFKGEIRRVANR